MLQLAQPQRGIWLWEQLPAPTVAASVTAFLLLELWLPPSSPSRAMLLTELPTSLLLPLVLWLDPAAGIGPPHQSQAQSMSKYSLCWGKLPPCMADGGMQSRCCCCCCCCCCHCLMQDG